MKHMGMPMGMWALFARSFEKQLISVFGYSAAMAKDIAKNAKPRYREIIARLPEFEKADRFRMNIVNCAMLGAFILSMPQRPDVARLTDYYARAMMTKPMRKFCRISGKSKVRSDPPPRPMPSGLYHERSGRRDELHAKVSARLRRAVLRLRIPQALISKISRLDIGFTDGSMKSCSTIWTFPCIYRNTTIPIIEEVLL